MGMRFGPAACLSENWLQSYYPFDLPSDWALDYLANAFPCAMINAEDYDLLQASGLSEIPPGLTLFINHQNDTGLKCADSKGLLIGRLNGGVSLQSPQSTFSLIQIDEHLWQSKEDAEHQLTLSHESDLQIIKRQLRAVATERRRYFLLSAAPEVVTDAQIMCQLLCLI